MTSKRKSCHTNTRDFGLMDESNRLASEIAIELGIDNFGDSLLNYPPLTLKFESKMN